MNEKLPLAFKILMISCSIIISVMLLSFFFYTFQVDKKYAILLPLLLTINSTMNPLGIYAAIKSAPDKNKLTRLNKIGLIGNSILYVLFLAILVIMGMTQMNKN